MALQLVNFHFYSRVIACYRLDPYVGSCTLLEHFDQGAHNSKVGGT